MNFFVDIKILPTPELKSSQILNSLYGKLHDYIAKSGATCIGVSFPGHNQISLGNIMRLHGCEEDLSKVIALQWLTSFTDYVAVSSPASVPHDAKHRTVSRVQVKSSPARLRRRAIKRHNLSEAEAMSRYPDSIAKETDLPFLQLRSSSTRQAFRLFVKHGPIKSEPTLGEYSAYGLSTDSTVPWF
jgi:CRISPR-associated endonuclease Csy4